MSDLLPEGTVVMGDSDARELMRTFIRENTAVGALGNTALDLSDRWSDRHSQYIIDLVWNHATAGSSVFVRPSFLAQPPVEAGEVEIEGYKEYKK